MLDFSINTNSLGPPQSLLKILKQNVGLIGQYPERFNTEISTLLSVFLGVPPQSLSFGVGSTQICLDIPKMLPYKRAVIVVPTFWEYTVFNSVLKKKIQKIVFREVDDFKIDYVAIQDTIKPGDCIFICNVNSPTSVLYDKKKLLSLIKNNPEIQFVVDETYLLFRNDFSKQSLVKQATTLENLHVIMSFSKFCSIPGLRLGVIVSNRKTIDIYNEQFYIPYSVSSLVLVAIKHLFKDEEFFVKTRQHYNTERRRLFMLVNQRLDGRLRCVKPEGNFIMGRILTGQKSTNIKDFLKSKGVLIRGGHELLDVTDEWIRFSIRLKKDNNFLVQKLDEVLIDL